MEFKILYLIQNMHNDILDNIMVFFTSLGNMGLIWLIITAILLINKKHRKCGILLIISLVLSYAIGIIFLKNIIGRPRPCWIDKSIDLLIKVPKDYSFPSGHTLISFVSAETIYLYNKKFGIYSFILAILISFSRMYLFVHFPTDILAGIILGIAVAFISKIIYNSLEKNIKKDKIINKESNIE